MNRHVYDSEAKDRAIDDDHLRTVFEMRRIGVEHQARLRSIRRGEILRTVIIWLAVASVLVGPYVVRWWRGTR